MAPMPPVVRPAPGQPRRATGISRRGPTQGFPPSVLRVCPDRFRVCPDFTPADSWASCLERRGPMACIKVLVVDDNARFRESAVRFLATEPGITVVGQAGSGREAIDMV